MSEVVWGRPHPSSDMDTAPIAESSLFDHSPQVQLRDGPLGGRARLRSYRSSTLIRQGSLITPDIVMRPR